MDARITKKRLGHMLSYDWIKIIALVAAAIVLFSLLFTMIATRASTGQTFYIYSYYDTFVKKESVNDLDNLKEKGALSYDVLDVTNSALAKNEYLAQMLAAYIAAQQGDVFFITDTTPTPEEGQEDEILYSEWQSFISGGYYSAFARLGNETYNESDLDDRKKNYFEELEKYLNKFYSNDFKANEIDGQAVEDTFRARMKKDKRFKTEKKIKAGIVEEKERIESLKKAYLNVLKAIDEDIISIKTTKLYNDVNKNGELEENEWVELCRGIDISNIGNITDFIVNKNTENSNEGLTMAIFDWANYQYHLQFEPITYLNFLILEYGNDAQKALFE